MLDCFVCGACIVCFPLDNGCLFEVVVCLLCCMLFGFTLIGLLCLIACLVGGFMLCILLLGLLDVLVLVVYDLRRLGVIDGL